MSLDSFEAALRALSGKRVLVGIPSDSEEHKGNTAGGANMRKPDPSGKPAPINNATLLYIHTNGAPEINLPERPVLAPAVKDQKQQIVDRLRDAGQAALKGNESAVDKNFNAIGLEVVSAARRRIQQGIPPPLQPATVARRAVRTKGSSYRRKASSPGDATPLIDTGSLLASLAYVIRDKK